MNMMASRPTHTWDSGSSQQVGRGADGAVKDDAVSDSEPGRAADGGSEGGGLAPGVPESCGRVQSERGRGYPRR